jgi:hypothetical protein
MAIVTYAFYTGTYMGETIAEIDFPKYEAKAERLIKQITHGRADNYDALPAFQQTAIQEAICGQIEYYELMGLDVSIAGEMSSGWTVGKVRVDGGSAAKATGAVSMVSPSAIAALEQTGLLNPQVETVGEPARVPYPWGWM